MIAFPSMLISAAQNAGMAYPKNPDKYSKNKYPHFFVFCHLQLGRRMQMGEQFTNAEIIAKIPVEELKTMELTDFLAKGLIYSAN